jgi:uncharacterized protein YdeI (YjbR/CyaY-like superfamily)
VASIKNSYGYMNRKIDFYFEKAERWSAEVTQLRLLALDCNLTEELKWGVPCYTYQKCNVVLIHVFKEYCALLFFNGALMTDPKSILVQQTENVQAARQVRFTNIEQIISLQSTLKAYINEAIEIEKSGVKVLLKKTAEFSAPDEFKSKLDNNDQLKAAFGKLTPGRQRAYLLYFSAPKQGKTRETRVEKCIPLIMGGKGLND